MPPKVKLTKKDILDAALGMIREKGIEALNARSLASRLSCSTQPVFSNFSNMDELRDELMRMAYEEYCGFAEREMALGEYPPYKASGMAYIRFAKEEPELFKLLFMCEKREGMPEHDELTDSTVIPLVMKNLGIEREEAETFHLEMWAFVHGIAVMFATSYFSPDREIVSQMLSDVYVGVGNVYKERKKSK